MKKQKVSKLSRVKAALKAGKKVSYKQFGYKTRACLSSAVSKSGLSTICVNGKYSLKSKKK